MAIDPKDRRSPCEQAIEKGLQCLNEKGSLNDLRLMNKPAVLKMIDETNNEYYATTPLIDWRYCRLRHR